jgi:hypothetical protein
LLNGKILFAGGSATGSPLETTALYDRAGVS